jgi:hypothetical protein
VIRSDKKKANQSKGKEKPRQQTLNFIAEINHHLRFVALETHALNAENSMAHAFR